jgi:hypothetical protein
MDALLALLALLVLVLRDSHRGQRMRVAAPRPEDADALPLPVEVRRATVTHRKCHAAMRAWVCVSVFVLCEQGGL